VGSASIGFDIDSKAIVGGRSQTQRARQRAPNGSGWWSCTVSPPVVRAVVAAGGAAGEV